MRVIIMEDLEMDTQLHCWPSTQTHNTLMRVQYVQTQLAKQWHRSTQSTEPSLPPWGHICTFVSLVWALSPHTFSRAAPHKQHTGSGQVVTSSWEITCSSNCHSTCIKDHPVSQKFGLALFSRLPLMFIASRLARNSFIPQLGSIVSLLLSLILILNNPNNLTYI